MEAREGYEYEFVEKPPKAECPICLLPVVLREPYQATCCGKSFYIQLVFTYQSVAPPPPIRAKVGDLTLLRSIPLMMGDEYALSVMGGELFTKM